MGQHEDSGANSQ